MDKDDVKCDGCGKVFKADVTPVVEGAEPAYLCGKCESGMRVPRKAKR